MIKSILTGLMITAISLCAVLATGNALAQSKTLTFATEATYPPFESINGSGKMQGFEIDLINALCNKMQTKCQFINQPFESLIPSLKLGRFDAIFGALVINDAKKKQVDFTQPFYKSTISFAASKKDSFPVNAQGLQGKIIGVQGGTNFNHYLQATYKELINAKKLSIKTYASQQEAFLDLKSGRIDAVVGDTPTIHYWLKQKGNENYQQIGKPVESTRFIGEGYGIAVKKGNQQLLKQLNIALTQVKQDGTLNKLVKQYFS